MNELKNEEENKNDLISILSRDKNHLRHITTTAV